MFVEAQSWWRTTPGQPGTDQGHGHLGACVPQDQTVAGVVHVDFVAKLHSNPGYLRDIVGEVSTDKSASEVSAVRWTSSTTTYACPTDCKFILPTDLDVSGVSVSGLEEFQYRLRIKEPDGHTMRPSLRWISRIANGKPLDDYSKRSLNGYGWYGSSSNNSIGPLYGYVRWHSPVPADPVSGPWTVNLSFVGDEAHISRNVTGYLISADPAFHAVPPSEGIVFYRGTTLCSPFGVGCDGPTKQNFVIDTTRLANGAHKLFMRADSLDSSGSTLSGVLVVPFTVANP